MTISPESLNLALEQISAAVESRRANSPKGTNLSPFVLGLTGLQGSGKSTWAGEILTCLRHRNGLKVISLSLDDLYHNHANLIKIRNVDSSNKLLRTRGQPGTHDTQLGKEFFEQLRAPAKDTIAIPRFDKSKFNGEGDRVPEEEWERVPSHPPIDVVIFEGWCVGFQPLTAADVERKWAIAKERASKDNEHEGNGYTTLTLHRHSLEHLLVVNDELRSYCSAFMGQDHFDFFVHLDTDDLANVYRWRIDQEHALIKAKGSGMSDEEVVRFVQGYMPGYELYLDGLRSQPLVPKRAWSEGRIQNNMRIVLDTNRNVLKIERR